MAAKTLKNIVFIVNSNDCLTESINQRNFYSAPYKTWTAALDNVNI